VKQPIALAELAIHSSKFNVSDDYKRCEGIYTCKYQGQDGR
jgi:hypothetical protein